MLLRRALPLLLLALLCAGVGSAATPVARIDVLDASIRPAHHRYNVRVVALVRATRVTTHDPDRQLNGTRTATVRWTGTWKNVKVSVLRPTSTTLVISANATGSIHGAFEFADRRPASACRGTKRISSPARLAVSATRPAGGPITFNFATFGSADIEPSFCPEDVAKLPFETLEATVQSLKVTTSDDNQGVSIGRRGRADALFFPVQQLRDGLGFSISTNARAFSNHNCGYSFCTKTVRSEARVTFTAAR